MVSFKSSYNIGKGGIRLKARRFIPRGAPFPCALFKGVCRIDALIDTPSCKVLVFSTFYRVRELDKVETVYMIDGSRQGAEIPPLFR